MGGSKGGFIPLLQAQRSSKLLFSWTVCYACLGKLRGLYDSNLAKIPFWKNTKLTTAENQILNFGENAKAGKSFDEIMSYKQTPVLSL